MSCWHDLHHLYNIKTEWWRGISKGMEKGLYYMLSKDINFIAQTDEWSLKDTGEQVTFGPDCRCIADLQSGSTGGDILRFGFVYRREHMSKNIE